MDKAEKDKREFANRLTSAMLNRGWNQSELARRSQIGRDNVSGYIRGHNLPNSKHLAKISEALNVPATWLLGGATGERFPAMSEDAKPVMKLEQLPDQEGKMRLTLRQDVPEDVAYQIAAIIRKSKGM
jgi:transcriptional regulator with XRE-family HTH domain